MEFFPERPVSRTLPASFAARCLRTRRIVPRTRASFESVKRSLAPTRRGDDAVPKVTPAGFAAKRRRENDTRESRRAVPAAGVWGSTGVAGSVPGVGSGEGRGAGAGVPGPGSGAGGSAGLGGAGTNSTAPMSGTAVPSPLPSTDLEPPARSFAGSPVANVSLPASISGEPGASRNLPATKPGAAFVLPPALQIKPAPLSETVVGSYAEWSALM